MTVAYLTHPSCARHDMGDDHPECPDRVRVIDDRLRVTGLTDYMLHREATPVSREHLLRAHSAHYLDTLASISPSQGYCQVDPDTRMNPHTLEAASHAAGAVVQAALDVVAGRYRRAFCNVRPPGHHAVRDRSMGFCFYNNVAVAMLAVLATGTLQRVALVDFDVHHGNGSENILAGDDRVLMVSTFQSPLYPYSGEVPLADNMVNVPLPPYSGGAALREAVKNHWIPALEAFAPQMIFISAGFDAHRADDLSQLGWTDMDYVWVTGQIVKLADRFSGGRIVSTLEGGYHLHALSICVEQHVRCLLGIHPGVSHG